MVQRHVVILNPAASVKGVKEQVVEGKTPEITIEQARTLMMGSSGDTIPSCLGEFREIRESKQRIGIAPYGRHAWSDWR